MAVALLFGGSGAADHGKGIGGPLDFGLLRRNF